MKKLFLCFFFYWGVVISQNKTLDSLFIVLKTAKQDTNKVNLLYEVSEICEEQDILKYSIPSLELARKLNYKKGIAANLNNVGYYYYFVKHNHEKALDNYDEALRLNKEIGNHSGEAVTLFNLGLVYKSSGLTEKSLDCFLEAMKIKENLNDIVGVAKTLNYVGSIYEILNLNQEAIESYLKAYELQKTIKDEYHQCQTLSNIAHAFEQNLLYDKAEEYYLKAIALHNINKKELAQASFQLGGVYIKKGLKEKAFQSYMTAIKVSMEINDKHGLAYSCLELGYLQYLNKSEEAIPLVEKAFAIGTELRDAGIIRDASGRLSKIYSDKKDFKKAFEMHLLFKQYTDSTNSLFTRDAVLKKQMQYDFNKKEEALNTAHEKEITRADFEKNKLRLILIGIAILFVFVVLFGLLIFRQNKLRSQYQSIELEQKLLRSQMNPHFIFNCLQAIQNFTLKNDGKQATLYLSAFGALTRSVLENSRTELVSLKKEIALLEHYLNLQHLLHGQKFSFTLHISPDLDIEFNEIPPMLSQPFIENAIEHGFKQMKEGGLISISFTKKGHDLILEITDNGKGIDPAETKDHHSLATTITKERIELYNKRNKTNASFTLAEAFPLQQNKGVKVTIVLPLS